MRFWLVSSVLPEGLATSGGAPEVPPQPNPTPTTPVDQVIEASIDVVAALISCSTGAFLMLVSTQLTWFFLRRLGKLHPFIKYFERRSRISGSIAAFLLGVYLGWLWSMHGVPGAWIDLVGHALLIVTILGVTWWLMRLCAVLEDLTRTHREHDKKPSRLLTQAQVLHRVLQAFFAVTGASVIALSFPQARVAMGSVLASAGIISLIAGIAAQGLLANMFAGVQIAFSDSIRVGDLVVVQGESGTIEEITLTYVVVLMWDGRRLILPSKKFTEDAFENWTKRDAQLLGTVEIHADWRLPLPSLRNEVDRLLNDTDLWDGRTANVQVTDSSMDGIVVRVAVSAPNSGDLWDLRCYLREHLIDWIQSEAPYALPRRRLEPQEVERVSLPEDKIALERQLRYSVISENHAQNTRRREEAAEARQEAAASTDPYGEPILEQYARRLLDKRRSWRAKARDLDLSTAETDEFTDNSAATFDTADLAQTKVFSPTTTISTERFYSGSPDAEKRRQKLTGASRKSDGASPTVPGSPSVGQDSEFMSRHPKSAVSPPADATDEFMSREPNPPSDSELAPHESDTLPKEKP